MDHRNRMDALFNPPATNGKHRMAPEPDQEIGALEHRQARRHRTATIIHIIGVLVLAGGLWLVASAIDSGLTELKGVIAAR